MARRFLAALDLARSRSAVQLAHQEIHNMSFDSSKPDLYEQVTQALITALEEGAGEYRMPWHSLSHPVNAASQKAYRGINTLLLWAAAQKMPINPTNGPPTGNGKT